MQKIIYSRTGGQSQLSTKQGQGLLDLEATIGQTREFGCCLSHQYQSFVKIEIDKNEINKTPSK